MKRIALLGRDTCCVILGKNRHIRLYPLSAIDGHDTEPVKIAESKGCSMFATGAIHGNKANCLCVAVKRHVYVYELNRTKYRHLKIKVRCKRGLPPPLPPPPSLLPPSSPRKPQFFNKPSSPLPSSETQTVYSVYPLLGSFLPKP